MRRGRPWGWRLVGAYELAGRGAGKDRGAGGTGREIRAVPEAARGAIVLEIKPKPQPGRGFPFGERRERDFKIH